MARQKADERDCRMGQRMAEARKRAKLTQNVVAAKFGLSKTQIFKYEKGTSRISAIDLDTLSRLTNTPISDFLTAAYESEQLGTEGLAESAQTAFIEKDEWSELAGVVARHVRDKFSDESRKEFIDAIDALRRELKGSKKLKGS